MHELASVERTLLEEMLEECEDNQELVHAKRFRADHISDVQVIDSLVHRRFIIENNGQYRVGLFALIQLESAYAKGIVKMAEQLWQAYREQYKEHLDSLISLSSAANKAGIGIDSAKRALTYMVEAPWYSGYTSAADCLYDAVGANETVLKYPTFAAFVAEMMSWSGSHANSSAPLDIFNSEAEPKTSTASPPSWVDELPDHVRLLLLEVHVAKDKNLPTLAAMGIRGVIDVICWDILQKDLGNFSGKLKKMLDEGHLSAVQHESLSAVVEAGNAASHRGFTPDAESLQTMLQALYHMIESIYVLQESAKKLSSKTPTRTRNRESK